MLYGQLRKNLGEVFHDLARQKESRIVEGHLQPDHVHMLLLIPPKYSVAHVVGYMKGKSAIYIARNYLGQKKNYNGMHFWARGYFVSRSRFNRDNVLNLAKYDPARPFFFCRGEDPAWVTRFHQ
jgi:putative transposase